MARDDKQDQAARFKAAAKKLGCNDDEVAFTKKLRRIAKPSAPKKRHKEKTPAK